MLAGVFMPTPFQRDNLGEEMRKTYRQKGVKQYWTDRWSAVEADDAMENVDKYPLSCSLELLNNAAISDIKILEAGCGTGRLVSYLHDRGLDVIGVDFVSLAIVKIKMSHPQLKVEKGDVKNLRFRDGTFSHVLAFGLYHNFEEGPMQNALVETCRVLRPGGKLCASFRADNLQNWLNDHYFADRLHLTKPAAPKEIIARQFHKINLTKSELRICLENAGFVVEKIYEIENMPLLFKFKTFRHQTQKNFDERAARRDGYLLNTTGSLLQYLLRKLFRRHFCNLYVVNCSKPLPKNGVL